MKPFSYFAMLAVFALIPACGNHKTDSAPPPPVEQPEAKPALSACEVKKADYLSKGLVQEPERPISIERHFQRVIRMNCSGGVASDGIETIKSPRLDFELRPDHGLSRKAAYVKIFDSETCVERETKLPRRDFPLFGQLSPLTGKQEGSVKVKMDLAEAWFTFKVTQGMNHLYYTYFESCRPVDSNASSCIPENELSSGVYNIFVTYTENTLPGAITVPANSCDQKKE